MRMDLVARILADPDNDLGEMASAFRRSGDRCWHIDRHVMVEASPVVAPPGDQVRTACVAALALARRWIEQSHTVRGSGLVVSRAYAILDDEWFVGANEA
jgi:hypothetical protein